MQRHAADHLYVKVAHAHDSNRDFTTDRKGFGQDLIEAFTAFDSLGKLDTLGFKRLQIQRLHLAFQRVDLRHDASHSLDFTLVFAAKQLPG